MFGSDKDFIKLQMPKIRRKYKVNIIGEMRMGGFSNKTNVQTEWVLTIQQIYNDNSVLFELMNYDSDVLESKNQGFKELSIVANQFKKATREVVGVIDKNGKLLRLINIDYIKERWEVIKNEIITFCGQTTDIEDFFKIENRKFATDDVLTEFVKQLEFFQIYFNGLYGKKIPTSEWRKSQNIFKTNDLEYKVEYIKSENSVVNQSRIQFNSIDYDISKKWIEKSYGNFKHMANIEQCEPKFNIQGDYIFDKRTGLINEATFLWDENVSSTLHVKTEYQVKSVI